MLFALVVGVAFAAHPPTVDVPPPTEIKGDFDAAPVPMWSVRLPGGYLNSATHTERTRPVIVGDNVLVGSAAGKGLYMLSRRDGGLVRTFPASASVESAAVVVDHDVFFADTGGVVWCYDLNGTEIWKHPTGAPILVEPMVDRGQLFATNVDDLAVALDTKTGELQWQYHRKPDVSREAELTLYAAPPAVTLGTDVLLGFSDGSIAALDRVRGDVTWEKRVGEGRYPDIVAAPVPAGTDILAAGYFKPLVAIDQASHNVRWRLDFGAANAVLVDQGVVFHPGTDGKLRAVAQLTGADKWMWDSGTNGALTTPVATPAGLIVGSSEGAVYLLNPKNGALLWQYHEPEQLEGVTSSPVVGGAQLLFVTNSGRLYSMVVPHAPPAPAELWARPDVGISR